MSISNKIVVDERQMVTSSLEKIRKLSFILILEKNCDGELLEHDLNRILDSCFIDNETSANYENKSHSIKGKIGNSDISDNL